MATKFEEDEIGWWIVKDPQAVKDYELNWAATGEDWLNGDTITGTPVWTVATGITKDNQSNTTTTTTIWLSGGTAGLEYTVSVRITTAGGRTEDQSFRIICQER